MNTPGFPKLVVPFWGPNNKDCSIYQGLHGWSPCLGKLPHILMVINPLRKQNVPPQPHEGARTLGSGASKASVSASVYRGRVSHYGF